MRHITDDERRARLAVRHGLSPHDRYADIESAARAMTVLHATEAASVHLSLWARVDGITVAHVDQALNVERSLVQLVAMRRTQFVFPRDLVPAAWGSAAARSARQAETDLARYVVSGGIADDPVAWFDEVGGAVVAVLDDGEPRTLAQIRDDVPALGEQFSMGTPDKTWSRSVPIGTWVFAVLAARRRIIRAANGGPWHRNAPTWTLPEHWLGSGDHGVPENGGESAGYAELVRHWLWTFGPGTESDIVWWLGGTKTAVRRALADLDAEPVSLDGDEPGWVLAGDTEPPDAPAPWAALLPTLDPTVMGWKGRDFYLDPADRAYLFDTAGNAAPTAWWNGRIVGTWTQDEDAAVQVHLRDTGDAAAIAALDAEATRLTAWLDGVRVMNVYAARQRTGQRLS